MVVTGLYRLAPHGRVVVSHSADGNQRCRGGRRVSGGGVGWGGVGEGGSLRVNAVIASHGTTGRAWKSKHEMKRWPALSSSWLSRAFWERRSRVPVQPCCRVGVGGRGGAHRGTGLKCWRHRVRSLSKSRDPLRISCASATQAHA